MVVTEALARGLPVITTTAGGLIESLGTAPDGVTPGLLVAPDDSRALAQAICAWLTDDGCGELCALRLEVGARCCRAGRRPWPGSPPH